MQSLRAEFPSGSYPIFIGEGSLRELGTIVMDVASHRRAALIMDSNIRETHGARSRKSLEEAGFECTAMSANATEPDKSLDAARLLYEQLFRAGLERSSPVVAVGGGIVGDLAGFVAATFQRGVPLVQIPTTLLAMVDASIGGKVGVNFPLPQGPLGKNMIGSFHQPRAVVADPAVLRTLPEREFRSGLAECIKHAMIADASLLDFIEHSLNDILNIDQRTITSLIDRCVRIKLAIVQQDERESGVRALLNLGHTFAHAIETRPEVDLRHGEAVAIGLVAAMHCAVQMKRMNELEFNRVSALLKRAHLPVKLSQPLMVDSLVDAMRHDKKVHAGKHRLILPRSLGRAEICDDVPLLLIEAAWREVGAIK